MLRQITAAAGSVQHLQRFGRGDGADQIADILPFVHYDLRLKAGEDIVRILFDDACCQALTELFMNPFIRERLEGLCLRCFQSQLVILFRTEIGSDTDAFPVNAFRRFKTRRFHFHQMRNQMFGTGCCTGMIQQLHGQTAEHLGHGHRFNIGNTCVRIDVSRIAHDGKCLLGQFCHHMAVVFAVYKMRNAPVNQRDVFSKDVIDAAGNQTGGSAFDNIQVGDNEDRCAHRDGFFLPFQNHRADVCGKAVGTGKRRYCDKGNAEFVSGVSSEVHDGSGTESNDYFGVVEILHHLLNQDVL